MASHLKMKESSRDRIVFDKEPYDYEEENDPEFKKGMEKKLNVPKLWANLFETQVAIPLETEATFPTDKWVIHDGLKTYESRMNCYTKYNDIIGGKLGAYSPVEKGNQFTPPQSDGNTIPDGYIRHYAHYHPDYPHISQDDLELLRVGIQGGILSEYSKIYAVSKRYVSVGTFDINKNKYSRGYWVRLLGAGVGGGMPSRQTSSPIKIF